MGPCVSSRYPRRDSCRDGTDMQLFRRVVDLVSCWSSSASSSSGDDILRTGGLPRPCSSSFSFATVSSGVSCSDFSHRAGMERRRVHLILRLRDGDDGVDLVCEAFTCLSSSKPASADGDTERLFFLVNAIGMMAWLLSELLLLLGLTVEHPRPHGRKKNVSAVRSAARQVAQDSHQSDSRPQSDDDSFGFRSRRTEDCTPLHVPTGCCTGTC